MEDGNAAQIHMECYSAVKKNEITNFSDKSMELEITTQSEGTETQKGTCHMFSLLWRC